MVRENGFLGNPAIKLPFPEEAIQVERSLRKIGLGNLCDQLITSINRAAEDAVSEATPIFIEAVQGITFTDAKNILLGQDDAATQYLKQNTQALLVEKFKPIVENSLHKVSATKYWEQLVVAYNKIPMVEKMNPNLSEYATQKAIDGIFIVVAEEELQIRKNPAARVSAILKKVFNR